MKKQLLIIFLFFVISPFFSLNGDTIFAHAASDGVNVHLGVDGCNNNSICEPLTGETSINCPLDCAPNPCNNNGTCESGIGETTLNCPADCTVVPPPPPPPPPPRGGRPPDPQNPRNVQANTNFCNLILLSWLNPTDIDFSYIRIMRNIDRFYGDPFSGDLIYEGRAQSFFDRNVTPGIKYYYTLFSRYVPDKFSTGSAISATASACIKIPTPPEVTPAPTPTPKPKPTTGGNNPPAPTPPANTSGGITVVPPPVTYLVHQNNQKVSILSATTPTTVNGKDIIIIDTEIVLHSDNYLKITGPNGENLGQYMFAIDKDTGRYISSIPPLQKAGTYTVNIFGYRGNNLELLSTGLLYVPVDAIPNIIEPTKNFCDASGYITIQYLEYILILFLLLLILKINKKESPVDNYPFSPR